MYLIDTNVFLEALLEQEKTLIVKSFLQSIEVEQMFMTDLTLHSNRYNIIQTEQV